MSTGRVGREWLGIRHLRRWGTCGAGAGVLLAAGAGSEDSEIHCLLQSIESNVSLRRHPIEQPPRLLLRSAGRTASPVSAVPIPISAYRPCHGMAFSASLDLASLQSEDINTIHTCCASFGSSNRPITPVLRATPQRKLCRQKTP